MPKSFTGRADDTASAERWLKYFEQYATYKKLKDADALALFKLLLADDAQDWLSALSNIQTQNLATLFDAFRHRYLPSNLQRYQTASTMWSRVQQNNESVDAFITALQKAARQIDLNDD